MSINILFSDIVQHDPSAYFNMDFMIDRLSIDTRTIRPGEAYLAIIGKCFDGHDFIDQAIKAGAGSIIVSSDVKADVPVLKTDNTVNMLGLIARLYRERLKAIVIGITGSNGKTTVKQMLRSVCELHGKTTATIANNNNTIGVPLTLLSAAHDDAIAIVEMGTSERGEIPDLVDIVRPDISVITNVSESHLSGFAGSDDIFAEKSAIIQGVKSDGSVIVNMDDDYSERALLLAADHAVIKYGFSDDADVHVINQESSEITVISPQGELTYRLGVPGKHNISNSMAVVALAQAAGIENDLIIEGLENYKGVKGRLQIHRLSNDITLIDDTYNANPASSHAALDVLAAYTGRKLFAYGGMSELGKSSDEFHYSVGRKAEDIEVDQLYAYGPKARETYEAFSGDKFYFDNVEDLSKKVAHHLTSGDTILIKGSRCFRMDRVSHYLIESVN